MAEDNEKNITIRYDCNDDIWLMVGDDNKPLKVYSFSAKVVDSMLAGYSLLSFYTGIVIVIGTAMRAALFNYTYTAFVMEINEPEPLIKLCECVHIFR